MCAFSQVDKFIFPFRIDSDVRWDAHAVQHGLVEIERASMHNLQYIMKVLSK